MNRADTKHLGALAVEPAPCPPPLTGIVLTDPQPVAYPYFTQWKPVTPTLGFLFQKLTKYPKAGLGPISVSQVLGS